MSIQRFLIELIIRFQMKRRFRRNPDVMLLRPMMNAITKRPTRVPEDVRISSMDLGGVRTERVASTRADESRAILYIHGGAFVAGSPETHRALTWRLAQPLRAPVYVIDYRLAPEHPYPAGLDDAVAGYRALIERGLKPERIAVAGDSAGGNLTFALALRLKAIDVALPGALVCLSPATELFDDLVSHRENGESDAMFDPRLRGKVPPIYCPSVAASDPFISPLRGDVSGFPSTLIQCSAVELLRDDSIEMAKKLRDAGVDVDIEVWPKVWHVWQLSADVVPEARQAIDKIVSFLRRTSVFAD